MHVPDTKAYSTLHCMQVFPMYLIHLSVSAKIHFPSIKRYDESIQFEHFCVDGSTLLHPIRTFTQNPSCNL
jgi:hypothetical protein